MARMSMIEAQFAKVTKDNESTCEIATTLEVLFKRDYDEFVRDRRRWKSDFETATKRAQNNLKEIDGLLNECL